MKFSQGQAIEMYNILSRYNDNTNWSCETEYGPYGSYYVYKWIGDEDPRNLAESVLSKIEALNEED